MKTYLAIRDYMLLESKTKNGLTYCYLDIPVV